MAHRAERFRIAIAGGAAAIALGGCGMPDTPVLSPAQVTGPTSASATQPQPDTLTGPAPANREVHELTAFRSPSGNVGCFIKVDYVRCDIDERNWSPPPRPAGCEWDYGQGISVTSGGPAQFMCAGDTAMAPDANPLPYGESITAGPMRCESAESGITCRDTASGHGFSISREAYRLF